MSGEVTLATSLIVTSAKSVPGLAYCPTRGTPSAWGRPQTRLRISMNDLARHLRRWHEPNLAAAVEGALDGDADQLPRRALALFSHGMGGLLDRPLCKTDGRVDQQATNRRDRIADEVHTTAKEALS
jgi:hypothetical protein